MRSLVMFLATAAMLLVSQSAFAQRDAGSKIRGEYNFYGNSAGSSMRSARENSTYYREYAQSAEKVNPEVAKESVDTIGVYITKAQKHMASMRKHAKATNDKETLAALDSIDKHLADASKNHADMKETCMKDNVDGKASMECCKVIDDSLAKAISEHDKLMKHIAKK
jgi:excinuclease UvrABC helicase subunit UvrB